MNITKKALTLDEMVTFTKMVCNNCFVQDENGNDVSYHPVLKHVALREAFVQYYTDYEMKEEIEENYQHYLTLDLELGLDDIDIDKLQWMEMMTAINKEIDFRKELLLQRVIRMTAPSKSEELMGTLQQAIEKYMENVSPEDLKALIQPSVSKNEGVA